MVDRQETYNNNIIITIKPHMYEKLKNTKYLMNERTQFTEHCVICHKKMISKE